MPADDCGVAQAMGVLGDAWSVLVLRDLARGHTRFEPLLTESGISRKVLAARLRALVEADVVVRVAYQDRPVRHDYLLTDRGRALLPVLAALQEWGDTWLLGDGTTRANAGPRSAEAQRVHRLVGTRVPELSDDPLGAARAPGLTVLYCYPGTALPGIDGVPGGAGCSLEACTYRDRLADFAAAGAAVVGVSTQTREEQAAFATANRIPFPLASDAGLQLTTALRLPTFRLGGVTRLKRLTLVVDTTRVVRGTLFPIADVTGSVDDALRLTSELRATGPVEVSGTPARRPRAAPAEAS